MSEQNRWSEDRFGSGRDNGQYARDNDSYRNRDDFRRDRQDFNSRDDERYGAAYGIASDYNYLGRSATSDNGQSDYSQGGDYNPSRYGQRLSAERFRDNRDFGRDSGRDFSRQGPERHGYGRDLGANRHQMGDIGRAQEDRSFWSQSRDEVSSWFGDDEARRRREQDELRAGEHRGRGPKGYSRSDDRIRDDVSDLLTDNARLDASDIEVNVAAAEVTLTGTVYRREDKRLAEDLADSVSGVKHVQNNLRLKDVGVGAATRIPVGGASIGSGSASTALSAAGAAAQPRTN